MWLLFDMTVYFFAVIGYGITGATIGAFIITYHSDGEWEQIRKNNRQNLALRWAQMIDYHLPKAMILDFFAVFLAWPIFLPIKIIAGRYSENRLRMPNGQFPPTAG